MKRADAKRATRAALVAAALAEFGESGLDASLDAICARAGVTRGAFYVHFADREALILATMTDVLGGFVDALAAASTVSSGRRGPAGIDGMIDLFIAAATARSPVIHAGKALRFFHVMDACHRSPAVREAYQTLVLRARDQIADVLARDTSSAVPAAALADLLLAAVLGVTAALELELPLDLPRLATTLSALARGRLSAPRRASRVRRAMDR